MEPKAETVPSYQRKMSSVFLVTFAIEQSPGKKAFFLSESQFFKVRSDGYVAAALDCDKSHQTALTPFPLIIKDLTYVTYVQMFLRITSMKYDLTKILPASYQTGKAPCNVMLFHDVYPTDAEDKSLAFVARTNLCQEEEISGAGATSVTAQAGPVLPNLSLGAPPLRGTGDPRKCLWFTSPNTGVIVDQ